MKLTPVLAAAFAVLSFTSCKEKAEEASAPAASSTAPVTAAVAPATAKTEDAETVLLGSMKESSALLVKFAEGGSKEDYIKGMKALAEKTKKLVSSNPEFQAKAAALAQDPKFMAAAQEASKSMQEVMAKHPEFAAKLADPDIQAAMSNLSK